MESGLGGPTCMLAGVLSLLVFGTSCERRKDRKKDP